MYRVVVEHPTRVQLHNRYTSPSATPAVDAIETAPHGISTASFQAETQPFILKHTCEAVRVFTRVCGYQNVAQSLPLAHMEKDHEEG